MEINVLDKEIEGYNEELAKIEETLKGIQEETKASDEKLKTLGVKSTFKADSQFLKHKSNSVFELR